MSQRQESILNECNVCGDESCNWYYGAMICEACKKFFIRSKKDEKRKYKCNSEKQCQITKSTRANCQYCRYVKCLSIGLDLNKKGSQLEINSLIKNLKCVVCDDKPSGIHFGVMTCEACKGFFRRSVNENQANKYKCKGDLNGLCSVNSNRSCRACRFKKCLQVGMSIDNCKLGRTTNKVKHEIIQNKHKLDENDEFDMFDSIYSNQRQNKRIKLDSYPFNISVNSSTSSETSSLSNTPPLNQVYNHSEYYSNLNSLQPFNFQNYQSQTNFFNYEQPQINSSYYINNHQINNQDSFLYNNQNFNYQQLPLANDFNFCLSNNSNYYY